MLLYYVTIKLNYKNMDKTANRPHPLYDIAPRAPLVDFLEATPDQNLDFCLYIFKVSFLICKILLSSSFFTRTEKQVFLVILMGFFGKQLLYAMLL